MTQSFVQNYEEFDDDERDEFLFRVLKALVVGGGMCQFDDKFDTYAEMTKHLYKDLIRYTRQRRDILSFCVFVCVCMCMYVCVCIIFVVHA